MSHTDNVLQGKLTQSAVSFVALFTRDKGCCLRATADKLRELAVALCACPKTRTGRKLPSLCVAVGGAFLGAGVGALTGAMSGAWGGVVATAFENIFPGAMGAAFGGGVTAACDTMLDGIDAVDTILGVFGSVIGGAAGGTAVGAVGGVIGGALISSGGSVQWYYHTALGVALLSAAGCVTGGAIGAVFGDAVGDAVGGAGGAMGGALGGLCGAQLATGAILWAAEASHIEIKVVRIVQEFQETIDPLVKELEVVKTICDSFHDPGATVQAIARRSRNALAAVDSMKRTFAECTAGSMKHEDTLAAARFERSARQCTQTIEELEKLREELGNFLASIESQI